MANNDLLNVAESCGASLDFAPLIKDKLTQAIDDGLGEKDWTATYEVTRKRAGLE